MKEEWRDIVGYEGLYQVSDEGRVRTINGRIKKQHIGSWGYPVVTLSKDGDERVTLVHRLVATAFVPNPRNVDCVNHIDESRVNNKATNLEWVTKAENNRHGTASQRTAVTLKKYYETRPYATSKPVRCVELDLIYPSITRAGEEWDVSFKDISACLKSEGRHTAGGLHWEYVDKEAYERTAYGHFADRGENLRIK